MVKLDNLQGQLPALLTESFVPLLNNSADPCVVDISRDLRSISLKHGVLHDRWPSATRSNLIPGMQGLELLSSIVVTDAWGKSEEARQAMKAAEAGYLANAALWRS